MASRLGVSLDGWPNTPKSPQPIWRAEGKNGEFIPRNVKPKQKHHCSCNAQWHRDTGYSSAPTDKDRKGNWEVKRQRNISWTVTHSLLKQNCAADVINLSHKDTQHKKITYVIHEHDNNVWRWNIWSLFCQGTTYYCTKESKSYSRHHSHRCAVVIWATPTSRK